MESADVISNSLSKDDSELYQLGAVYFNQDYDLDYGTADHAVLAYIADADVSSKQELVREISLMLTTDLSEAQIEHIWSDRIYASYAPTVDGIGYRDWFSTVLRQVRDSLPPDMYP